MSKIEWTGETWNPVVGCSVISPGCTNCYAMTMAGRIERMDAAGGRQAMPHYAGLTKPSKAGDVWTGKVALAPDAIMTKPLTWKKPRTIFVCSMADLFHESVPDAWIDRVFAVMALCPQHTFQVLTKRSDRMRAYLTKTKARNHIAEEIVQSTSLLAAMKHLPSDPLLWDDANDDADISVWPLPNVWLGVSAEDQKRADERIPDLLATPAAVRFVSAEPLLGPIDFTRYIWESEEPGVRPWPRIDWIIVGGESGPGARPMHPDWARAIRDQCGVAEVDFFFKQWGAWEPYHHTAEGIAPHVLATNGAVSSGDKLEGCDPRAKPRWITIRKVGKARAGRILDGRTHDAMPAAHRAKEPA